MKRTTVAALAVALAIITIIAIPAIPINHSPVATAPALLDPGNGIATSSVPTSRSVPGQYTGSRDEYTTTMTQYTNVTSNQLPVAIPSGYTLTDVAANVSGMTGASRIDTKQDVAGVLGEPDGINVRRFTFGYDLSTYRRNEIGMLLQFSNNVSLQSVELLLKRVGVYNDPQYDNLWRRTTIELRANEPSPSDQPHKTTTMASVRLNDTNFYILSDAYQKTNVNFGGIDLESGEKYWVVVNATASNTAAAYLALFYFNDTSNDILTSNRSATTISSNGNADYNVVQDGTSWITSPVFDPYLKIEYAITDPLNVDEVAFNGTIGGIKKSFNKTGTGSGSAAWNGLSITGTSVNIQTEAPVKYDATVVATFRRSSSISYSYVANASSSVSWSSTFSTTSTGDGYNFTAGYHPGWSNVKVSRNGTDVTGLVSIAGGVVTVPAAVAAGNNSWVITCESPNRVLSFGFGKGVYYRGQTLATSKTIDMANLQTELVTYYDPSGVQRGATIGDNFPLGVYTAVYWCENGTDAGWAMATILVTDNGSINVRVSDALGRDVPGVLVNVTLINMTGYTNLLGRVSLAGIEFGNYTVAFSHPSRGSLGSAPVEVNGSGIQVEHQLPSQFVFEQVPVTIMLADKFGDGFAGRVTLANITGVITTELVSGTAGGNGFFQCSLDEGNYSIAVEYPDGTAVVLNASTIHVRKDTSTSFAVSAPGTVAYPQLRTASLDTSIKDAAGRWLPGVNVTVTNDDGVQWKLSGPDGKAFFPSVYWGNDASFDVAWIAPNGTVLDSTTVALSTTGIVPVDRVLPFNYTFTGIPVTILVQDRFGDGFPARVVVDNGTVVFDGFAGSNGFASMMLDEGDYVIEIWYPGSTFIDADGFTVIKDVTTSFTFTTTIDAFPAKHVATLVTHLEDALHRDIHGVTCRVTGVDGTWQASTGTNGNTTTGGIYWGNSTSFTVEWIDARGIIDSVPVTLSESKTYYLSRELAVTYTFTNLAVSFNFTDKNAAPFPAFVSFFKDGTIPSGSGAAGGNGYYQTVLDEGNYIVKVEYPSGTFVGNASFTVDLSNNTARYNFNFDFSSQIKICSLVVNVKDALGRDVYPVMVRVNGTGIGNVSKSAITDGGGNALFTGLAYQDYPGYTIYVYSNASGTGAPVNTTAIVISSDVQNASIVMATQFHFPDIVVTFTVVDAFGAGYRANITILDATNATTLLSEITTVSGQRVVDLDEGTYSVVVRHESIVVANRSFTILKGTGNAFTIPTGIDAYPETRTKLFTVTVNDTLGRYIGGLRVNMTSSEESYEVTGTTGTYSFLSVYYGFAHVFDVTVWDVNGTLLHAEMIDASVANETTWTVPGQYIFRDVPVQVTILDINGRGFAANVEIRFQNGSVAWTGQSSANGLVNAALDEGNYTAVISWINGTHIGDHDFIVQIDLHQDILIQPNVNAYPPGTTDIMTIVIVIIVIAAAIIGVIGGIFLKNAKKKEAILKQRENEIEKLKAEVTEEDIKVSKEKHVCLVHKGPIEAFAFICPGCGSFYCQKCLEAIKEIDNSCWSCKAPLDPTKSIIIADSKDEETTLVRDKSNIPGKKGTADDGMETKGKKASPGKPGKDQPSTK